MAKKKTTTKSNKELLLLIHKDIKKINKRLLSLEKEEKKDVSEEKKIESDELRQLDELAKLEIIEKEIKKRVEPHPLKKITYHDISKGIIGAFFGIVGHFAFFYGSELAEQISLARANLLILTSFVILILFIYFSGFRTLKRDYKLKFIPWRVIVIFLTAHIVILFVLILFGRITSEMHFEEIYKNIASVSILAVRGAATADLIGGD